MMEGSQGGLTSPAPFLIKTYDMLDDPSTDSVVSWNSSGSSFVVWNPLDFARDLLPAYFKHNNFSSFIRQLNTYGFRKIDPERWEFANDEFIRGQKHLLRNIHRRKPIHSHSAPLFQGSSASIPLSESEKAVLKQEIKTLKHEKGSLLIELEQLTQCQHGIIDQHMQNLEERLQAMVLQQRSLLSFLSQVVQRPGFLADLVGRSDLHNKKRRLPRHDCSPDEPALLDTEPFEKVESSLNSLETFLHDVGRASGEEDDPFLDAHVPSSSHSGPSSPEVAANSPEHPCDMTPGAEFGFLRSRVAGIDVNSDTAVCPAVETERKAVVPMGANDMFWEQFLTESPGCFDAQEEVSERREDGRRADRESEEKGSVWWSRKSVDHLAERMGHLTSAQGT